MNRNNPIGIFDSGVGGTSIWQEIHRLLPFENTLYLADSKNAPYGNKSENEIVALSIKNTEKLISEGCKMIVVACNTATTNAISKLRATYDIPFIGIEPAIKPAALQTNSKSIGILATKGTLSSSLFHKTTEEFTKDISVIEIVGEGMIPLIEKGALDSPEMIYLLEKFTAPMLAANVDYIVLGCSHYPYIVPQLRKLIPTHVKILDSGEAVAKQTAIRLQDYNLLREETENTTLSFLSNSDPSTLKYLLKDYSEKIKVQKIDF